MKTTCTPTTWVKRVTKNSLDLAEKLQKIMHKELRL
jgi:hypothetical protein